MILFFVILALTVVAPLLFPGFILSFDIAAVPFNTALPSFFSSTFLFGGIWALLSLIVSTAFLEKLLLFLIFFLSGWGMYRLTGKKSRVAGIFAGSLYAVNPFVYERIMIGHWSLLLGYSLLPFLVGYIQDFFEAYSISNIIKAALLTVFILSIDLHFVLILTPVLIIIPAIITYLQKDAIKKLFKGLVIFIFLVMVGSLNWLVPIIFGRSDLISIIQSFNVNDLIAFQSFPDPNFGLIFNLLSGYGLWTEASGYFLLPKDLLVFWPLLSVLILAVVFVGIYKVIKNGSIKDKALVVGLIATMVLSLDFAGGVALPAARDWIILFYDKFPVLRGLREPQKLIGLLMFCYAYLGAQGIPYIKNKLLIAGLLILPFVYTLTVFGSFWGQLKPVSYPDSWLKVKQILDKDNGKYLTLAFPWHQYMRYQFNNNQPATNLAPHYFGTKILSSGEYETRYLDSHETRPEALHVSGLLRIQREKVNLLGEKVDISVDWAQNINVVGIKYILLAKEEDWINYHFLDQQKDLKKVFDSPEISLYENLRY